MSSRFFFALVLVGGVCLDATAGTILMINDRDMRPSSWDASLLSGNKIGNTRIRLVDSRFVNTEALLTDIDGPGGFTFDVGHHKTNAFWDPSVHGTLETIRFDASVFIDSPVTFAASLFQSGTYYVPPNSRFVEPGVGVSQGLLQFFRIGDFSRAPGAAGTGGQKIDTSLTADPIFVGYNVRRGVLAGDVDSKLGNFRMQLTGTAAVPEPSTAAGFLSIVVSTALFSRRSRRTRD
ncbi:MAG: PEP-CTERM sorting domain-containing protein [Planctomycetota bacterium]